MKKGDLIIITVALLITAVAGIAYSIYLSNIGDQRVVNIYIKNELYASVNLNKDTNEEIIVEQDINGKVAYNIVHIYNMGVQVEEANCHNQNDVRQGFVKIPGLDIICLPHNLRVVIEGGNTISDGIAS
jgi:hypothetical protein